MTPAQSTSQRQRAPGTPILPDESNRFLLFRYPEWRFARPFQSDQDMCTSPINAQADQHSALHARAETDLVHLLPRVGPLLAGLLVVFWAWDWLLDPRHALQSGMTRLVFAGLAAIAFWPTPFPWSAHMRAGWAHWMLSSGVILATAQLDGGLAQGVAGIIVGLFLVPFIANGTRNFLIVVLPPALLFAISCALRASWSELLRGMMLYGSGVAVAYVQMRMALSMRAHTLKIEARLMSDATHDALTGCCNRAWLSQAAARAFSSARRYRTDLVFAMLDIDHFKRVNDTYGHGVGDEVLKAVARACQGELRDTDHFGRLGGEEFFSIFPNTAHEAASECAERIRQAVAATQVPVDGRLVSVTISIGLCQMTRSHPDWEHMLNEADEALYAAKSAGRNCIR